MPASGRSDNRLYEYNRGRSGGGHGIYAAAGRRDREAEERRSTLARASRVAGERGRDRDRTPGRSWFAPPLRKHPQRLRTTITHGSTDTLYGGVEYFTNVTVDPTGRSLTSMLPDGRHAPVLDVDHPVTVRPVANGTLVTITVDVDPHVAQANLKPLVDAGLIQAYGRALLADAPPAARWWRRWRGWVGQVQFVFPFPVEAVPSKSAGHFHLLVQSAMEWEQAKGLARRLAAAGVVDAAFAAISGRGDFMYVNTPPSALDTI